MSNIVYKNFDFSTPFLRGYDELRIPIIDGRGNPAWPEKFPTEKIADLRDTVGPRHFASQMMLENVSDERARLDPGWLDLYDGEFDARTARIGDVTITGACVYWDPATGRRNNDGSVCVMIYRDDKNRHVYIHDIMYMVVGDDESHPLGRQCERVLDFMAAHNMHKIWIETNGIGNALPEIMRDVGARRGTRPVIEKIINTRNKEIRILDTIEPILSTGRLHAHARVRQSPLMAEMLGWAPVGATGHDDGIDAVAGAIMATPIPVRAIGTHIPTYRANTKFKL